MYSRVKWHLKHVSSSIALAHVAGHDANEEHSRSLYKCAQCTYIYMWARLCMCGFWYFPCLATIWASLAGTVRAAEATHETCLLINTTMNHFTFPARGVSWQNAFVSLHLHTCVHMYVSMWVYVFYTCICCTLLSVLFAAFASVLRFLVALFMICLWFSRLVSFSLRSFAFGLRFQHTYRYSYTHTHTVIRSYLMPLHLPLSFSLSRSFAQFAWCELWLRFGTCHSLHAQLFLLLLLFVSLF